MRQYTTSRVLVALGTLAATLALTPAHAHGEPEPRLRPGQYVTFAGGNEHGDSGDGGPATKATLHGDLSVDAAPDGTVYIADEGSGRVRRVDRNGVIDAVPGAAGEPGPEAVTVSQDGTGYFATVEGVWRQGPDGAFAMFGEARTQDPSDIAVDGSGTVYVADSKGRRILRIDQNGTATTLARTEQDPTSVAVDSSGYVYFTTGTNFQARNHEGDANSTVHRIAPDGTVGVVLGGVGRVYSGDGAAATTSGGVVSAVTVDDKDNVYLVDGDYRLVRMIDTDGFVTTVGAVLGWFPIDMSVGPNGNVYLATDGAVDVLASGESMRPGPKMPGPASPSRWADRDPGTVLSVVDPKRATASDVSELTVDPRGTFYFHRDDFAIGTLDRAGKQDVLDIDSWDGSADPTTTLRAAVDFAAAADGTLYVSDPRGIQRVYPDGSQAPTAGYGPMKPPLPKGQSPLNLRYLTARLAVAPDGAVFAMYNHNNVYRIAPDGTAESFVHSNRDQNRPNRDNLAVDRHGALYISDYDGNRVLKVDDSGTARTIAGTGRDEPEGNGDGGPAIKAVVPHPKDVAVGPDGSVYVSTVDGDIRRIDTHGTITTLVHKAFPYRPGSVNPLVVDPSGDLYFISDKGLQVVVRPAEITEPFPWNLVWLGVGAVVLLAAVITFAIRRRRSRN